MPIHESLTEKKMKRAGLLFSYCINCGAEYATDSIEECFHCDAHRSVAPAPKILAMIPKEPSS